MKPVAHWVSASCEGETCSVRACGNPASHKLAEEIQHDDPDWVAYRAKIEEFDRMTEAGEPNADLVGVEALSMPHRHGLVGYVCCDHFKQVVGRAAPCGETRIDVAVAAYEMIMSAISLLVARADQSAAKNFVAIAVSGVDSPFDRCFIELVRPGGKNPAELAEHRKQVAIQAIVMLNDIARALKAGLEIKEPTALLEFANDLRGQLG